jgi:hypothetical protein
MATLLLQAAGTVVGTAIGGPFGGILGRAAGALAGSFIDQSLLGSTGKTRHVEGPRLKEMDGLSSTEGAPIPKVYGRARIGGQLIWATKFEEVISTTIARNKTNGGKGNAAQAPKTVTTSYSYFANLAIGLCEGEIALVRRIWADGRELDLSTLTLRTYYGTQTQTPDALIVAKEGAANAPAYRGLAYVVFERLPLADFGNRIPQLTFEVIRPVEGLAQKIKSVCLIPASTEFGYDTVQISQQIGMGTTRSENRHQLMRVTDMAASLDMLERICPNVQNISLVVSWFGDDLRAGNCTVRPKVENAEKQTSGDLWQVAGLTRETAQVVSQVAGKPSYGGTPSDSSVIRLIQALKARGYGVTLYPFIMMDVPSGNTLINPWTGSAGQPAYPWRGRISCSPAIGVAGTVDGSAAAAAQIDSLFGTATPSQFSISSGSVNYIGATEWTLRRHILHMAHLAVLAANLGAPVDAFILGSEMVSLTRVRGAGNTYAAVSHYISLAADVKSVLSGSTKLTYAADWTEYGAYVRGSGAEVSFPLDALWGNSNIDAVGIDFYPPLSDWRDGVLHTDAQNARAVYDLDYLRDGVAGGEAFAWYYASAADRAAQIRTPITDGAYNKPWIYRAKDLVSWWQNMHYPRSSSVESTTPTAWAAQSKPIWLTEIGIPAVDKGTNGPNVFPDQKSSEDALPPFSRGYRDDLNQVQGLSALLSRFDPDWAEFMPAHNPVSTVYGGRMVDPTRISVWAWDARPYPAFPTLASVWADGANWHTGHWITGRLEGAPLGALLKNIAQDFNLPFAVTAEADGFLEGYVLDRTLSPREAIEPLSRLFGFDVKTQAGVLHIQGRGGRVAMHLTAQDLILDKEGAPFRLTRAQETDLPAEVRLSFTDSEGDYRRATVASRRLSGQSQREVRAEFACKTHGLGAKPPHSPCAPI